MKQLFIVGAQRSGSTYLYQLLDNHPQVMMAKPVRPEPKFFLDPQLFAKGRTFYETTYFSSLPPETLWLGEKSTSYIESLPAARRIREFYPEARVLMILRDPVERAWSNYRFTVKHGLEPLPFETALEAEPDRLSESRFGTSVNPYAYRQRGYYLHYIRDYLKVFDASQISILIFEEMIGDVGNIQQLYHSLGLCDSFTPPGIEEAVNAGEMMMAKPLAALRQLAAGYQESVRQLEEHLGRPLPLWRRNWETL